MILDNLRKPNSGILRWKIDLSVDDAMDIVKEIGRGYSSDFVIDQHNEYVYRNIIKWIHGDDSMQAVDPQTNKLTQGRLKAGVYIAGTTGTGKSWCLDILRDYAIEIKAPIHFVPDEHNTQLVWSSYNASDITDEYKAEGNIREIESKKLLCIQDLGCEPEEIVYMGNRVSVLKSLIERRGDKRNRMLLVTSNRPMDKISSIYGDRVASRLNQMCNYFILLGEDRRIAR